LSVLITPKASHPLFNFWKAELTDLFVSVWDPQWQNIWCISA